MIKELTKVSCRFKNTLALSKASHSTFRKQKVFDMLWTISDKNWKGWTVYV